MRGVTNGGIATKSAAIKSAVFYAPQGDVFISSKNLLEEASAQFFVFGTGRLSPGEVLSVYRHMATASFEVVIASEVYLWGTVHDVASVREALTQTTGRSGEALKQDEEAVRHALEAAATGGQLVQIKEAYRIAIEEERVGIVLHQLFHTAFHAARRIETERVAEAVGDVVVKEEQPQAALIIEEMRADFVSWVFHYQAIKPAIEAIQETFETIRKQEVARNQRRFSSDARAEIDHLTRAMMHKALAVPVVNLQHGSADIDFVDGVKLLRSLFTRSVCED